MEYLAGRVPNGITEKITIFRIEKNWRPFLTANPSSHIQGTIIILFATKICLNFLP